MMSKYAVPAVAAILLWAAPALANECTEQLAALQGELQSQPDIDEDRKSQIEDLIAEAIDANRDGDEETCLSAIEDARALLTKE